MNYARPLRMLVAGVVASGLVVGIAPAYAQGKEVKGEVTAVSDTSLTVRSGGRDMIFMVTPETLVEARGAGRRSREARATGTSGIKVTDYVAVGRPVLVRYSEADGKNRALMVRPIAAAGDVGAPAAETKIANGKVKAVTGKSITIERDGKDMVFAVDSKTDVVARGAGTASKEAGGHLVVTDLVHSGDTVSISYRDTGGTMTASMVRITVKAR